MLVSACATSASAHEAFAHVPMGSIGVAGNQGEASYEGTGGLLLPTTFTGDASSRFHVASCTSCVWKYTIYCAGESESMCAHAVVTCPLGMIRYRVGFGATVDSVVTIGSVCWGSSKPPTRRDIVNEIKSSAVRYLPVLRPGLNPATTTLTTIPVIAWSGQTQQFIQPVMTLAGRKVRIVGLGRWRWNWGDGHYEWRAQPGRPFPNKDVLHIFSSSGTYVVSVSSDWSASYIVEGIGKFPVDGPNLTQSAGLRISVASARSVLVVH